MASYLQTQGRNMKGLNPITHGEKVALAVYRSETNERLVRKFRGAASYGGTTSIDVVGCNFLCSYCWVDTSLLIGRGPLLEREVKAGKIQYYTPERLSEAVQSYIRREKTPRRIKLSAGEPFLTPEWMLGLIQCLEPFLKKHQEQLWIETNGFALVQNPEYIERLKPHASFIRFFVSSKSSPDIYTAMTRVDDRYADTAFQCIDMLWKRKIVSFLQAPMAHLFFTEAFRWYYERLLKIHPAAPLLMHLDLLNFLPLRKIRKELKAVNLWDTRKSGVKTKQEWKEFLEQCYGRKMKPQILDIDASPEHQELLRQFIFENRPLEEFPLFAL